MSGSVRWTGSRTGLRYIVWISEAKTIRYSSLINQYFLSGISENRPRCTALIDIHPTELCRRHALYQFEHPDKRRLAFKPGFICNVRDRHFLLGEQQLCMFDPLVAQILVKGLSGKLLEQTAEMEFRESCQSGHLIQIQIFRTVG